MTGVKLVAPIILRPHIAMRTRIEQWAKANGIVLHPPAYGNSVKHLTKPKEKSRTMKVMKGVVKLLLSERPY